MAEKAGMKWSCGDHPTQHYEYWENRPIYIRNDRDSIHFYGLVQTSSDISDCRTVVNFSDLDLSDYINEKYQLEIKQKKRSVIATLYDDKGAFVKYAKAVCSPEDKFDFEVGKRIALQRLFNMSDTEPEIDANQKIELIRGSGGSGGFVSEPTEIESYGHIKLFVGDVVELFDSDGNSRGLRCVCKDYMNPKGFVMGVAFEKFINGESNNWLIVKRKSYMEMNVGDTVGVVEYKPARKETQ